MVRYITFVALAVALLLAVFSTLLASWDVEPLGTAEIRYELRVEMTIDGRPVTASTVHGLRVSENLTFGLGAPALLVKAEGQAIVHAMGDRRGWLIVPLVGETQGNVDSIFISSCIGSRGQRSAREYVEAIVAYSGSCEVAKQYRPLLIQTADKNDKTSLRVVDPGRMSDSFGPGVELRQIVMVPTDDPVPSGVLRQLPWLQKRTEINFEYIWVRGVGKDRNLTDGQFATELRM